MRPILNNLIKTLHINTHSSHVIHAAQNPIDLDDRQANAVSARIELDLRLGAAFTRYQTLTLQTLGGDLANKLISYGEFRLDSCLGVPNSSLYVSQDPANFQLWDSWLIGTFESKDSSRRSSGASKSCSFATISKCNSLGAATVCLTEARLSSSLRDV